MAIRTHQSLSGYVATAPNTDPTSDGTPRFYARAGQRQGRREPDGTYTKLPTQYVPIVAYGDAAEEATALLAKGVGFVAEGRFRPVRYEKDGKTITGHEFEVWKVGRRHSRDENTATRDATAEQITCSREVPAEFTAPRSTGSTTTALAM
ncbi:MULTISPECIES: single-stranded DNA-binding protein [Micrococcales]|uniref:single-stranded DNA-binding protein n=1 Tax=Micrococcales TaxID=85006 RepID=UPI00186868C3|nr:single-stranded DNA-binding protein [Brevibacterium aurantiacum]